MIDREDFTHETPIVGLEHDEQHPYEPPTLTPLGSFAELTETKAGPVSDPGTGFQPSRA